MSRNISFINLKGGVGKTTLTVAVAEILSIEFNKKVLVIDLDPQTNATVLLISQEEWEKRNNENRTIHQLFFDKIENTNVFDINEAIISNVSNIKNKDGNLDLLPSSIDLIDITDEISALNRNNRIIDIINSELQKKDVNDKRVVDKYDYILIDCPPNLGGITMCGVYISNYYIIPVLPDTLSTYGLKQVINKIEKKTREIKRLDKDYNIKALGVAINRYRDTKGYNRIKDSLILSSSQELIPEVFNSILKNKANYCDTCDLEISKNTIRQKYGDEFKQLKEFVLEIIQRCDNHEK
ncbi:MAG: AAA family ATPase [Clostridium sp.]|uniref:ParA family protein n=1 Tax=Clostridium sp. TaxID=1506 RepID=UPI0029159780|nr:AAA family ATPase [Clostridium sp.]MDU5109880.1 AAA family ATPase [Clostridium sp.]